MGYAQLLRSVSLTSTQYSPVCIDQPAPLTAGSEVPSHQVPPEHLHNLHPKLPRQEPPNPVHLLRGRHEGTNCWCNTVWWDEPNPGW